MAARRRLNLIDILFILVVLAALLYGARKLLHNNPVTKAPGGVTLNVTVLTAQTSNAKVETSYLTKGSEVYVLLGGQPTKFGKIKSVQIAPFYQTVADSQGHVLKVASPIYNRIKMVIVASGVTPSTTGGYTFSGYGLYIGQGLSYDIGVVRLLGYTELLSKP